MLAIGRCFPAGPDRRLATLAWRSKLSSINGLGLRSPLDGDLTVASVWPLLIHHRSARLRRSGSSSSELEFGFAGADLAA